MGALLLLVELMGREAYAGWSKQLRSRNNGQPPSQRDVDNILAIYEDFGADEFRRMVREEYGGSGGSDGGSTRPSLGQTTSASTLSADYGQIASSTRAVQIFKREKRDDGEVQWCGNFMKTPLVGEARGKEVRSPYSLSL
jgi:hypothetical protein